MSTLSEEQKRRIEENRRKALEKLASRKFAKTVQVSSSSRSEACVSNASKPVDFKNVKDRASYSTANSSSIQNKRNYNEIKGFTNGTSGKAMTLPASSGTGTSLAQSSKHVQAVISFSKKDSGRQQPLGIQKPHSYKKTGTSSVSSGQQSNKPWGTTTECKQTATGWEKSVRGTCVLINEERFKVSVMFYPQLIALFKTIPSKSYDAKTTTWDFHLDDYKQLMNLVKPLAPAVCIEPLPKSVMMTYMTPRFGTVKELSSQDISLNNVDDKLVQALMPFQTTGIKFGIRNDGRVLIADDMGLGKTIQSICIASYYRAEWPLLVICPSSVRVDMEAGTAFCRWVPSLDPEKINVVWSGKDSILSGKVTIVSYDLLAKKLLEIKKHQFRVVIADESHFLKNYKTARAKAAVPILKGATRVILLSGTPALSRPMELYTQISAVDPKLFPSFHEFGLRYCAGTQNRFGWDYSGASNMQELQLLLEHRIMIRRLKSEVLTELPPKRRQVVTLDPSLIKTKSLEKAAKDVTKAKETEKNGALLVYFNKTATAKLAAVREYLMDQLEGGHKFLVFAHHKAVLDALCDCLYEKRIGHIRIDGSTPSESRQLLCEKYQTKESCRVAVLSITAANTGLTLTAADSVVFAELFWNPGALVQAEDRVYRIGQKNSVIIHYLVAAGTADDYLWPLIQGKLEVLSKAGLSKDDFSAADMRTFQDPKQQSLLSFFETLVDASTDADLLSVNLESFSSQSQYSEATSLSNLCSADNGSNEQTAQAAQTDAATTLQIFNTDQEPSKCDSARMSSLCKRSFSMKPKSVTIEKNSDMLSIDLEDESDLFESPSTRGYKHCIDENEDGSDWLDELDFEYVNDFEDFNHNEPLRKKKRL